MPRDERHTETIPYGTLGIIPLASCTEMGKKVDEYLVKWRDVCNYSLEYTVCGFKNHMSPDDHYADLKRVIAAAGGKARRINVIMPFLYESRQHKRTGRESLDCALALEELIDMNLYHAHTSLSSISFLMWTTFTSTASI